MRKENKQIFKVQVPIATNQEPMAFIYDEERHYMGHTNIGEDLKKMMGKELKKFFYGVVDEEGLLHIKKEAPWQEW